MKNAFKWIGAFVVVILGAWVIKQSWGNPDYIWDIVDYDNLPDFIRDANERGSVANDNLDFGASAVTTLDALKEQFPRRIHHAK